MRTKYLPDMKKFQLQLYQLSRLVKDHLPDLYVWLDQNDVSPTLYAAPWILTVFSSQFPLGFVARVFDLLFLESSDVIFKFAVALLSVHKPQLLACDNFEEIMDYLKSVVPKMEGNCMEQIMKLVFTLDIGKQLAEYNVEYNVLQEEITTTNHHLEMLNREKSQNQHLEQQLQVSCSYTRYPNMTNFISLSLVLSSLAVCTVIHCAAGDDTLIAAVANLIVAIAGTVTGANHTDTGTLYRAAGGAQSRPGVAQRGAPYAAAAGRPGATATQARLCRA